MQKKENGAAATLRLLNGLLAVVCGITAIVLTLGIYLRHSEGQMYTAALVQSRLRILLIPLALWLLCSLAAAITVGVPKKAALANKPTYSDRPALRRAMWALFAVAAAWMLIYLCSLDNFASRDLEQTVGRMVLFLLPAAAVLLVCAYALQRQPSPKPAYLPPRVVYVARLSLLLLALAFLAHGIWNGGMRDVLVKAINICTECIGLG